MNPRLVRCLFASSLIGILIAGGAVASGLSILLALPLFSVTGSVALVVTSLVAMPSEEAISRLAAEGRPRARKAAAHA